MKKILLLVTLLSVVALSSCTSNNINARLDDIEQRISVLEGGGTPSPKTQVSSETNTQKTSDAPSDLNVLSFELSSTDPNATKNSVKHTYQVTNKGNEPIEYISIDVAYYDANGNCIDTDGRFKDVVIESGKFVTVDSYGGEEATKGNIASSKVVSYDYYLINPNANGNNKITVNCETGKTKESSVNR